MPLRMLRMGPMVQLAKEMGPSMCNPEQNRQWLFFGRDIGQLTPKIIYFHSLRKSFLDQSIQKYYLTLKKEALKTVR